MTSSGPIELISSDNHGWTTAKFATFMLVDSAVWALFKSVVPNIFILFNGYVSWLYFQFASSNDQNDELLINMFSIVIYSRLVVSVIFDIVIIIIVVSGISPTNDMAGFAQYMGAVIFG